MKLNKKIGALLLVNLLLIVASPFINTAKADVSFSYAPNYHQWFDLPGEEDRSCDVVWYIDYLFEYYAGYGWTDYFTYGSAVEWQYESNAQWAEWYWNSIAFFSKGHASSGYCPDNVEHHYFFDHNGNPVYDKNYGWYTYNGKHYLVFIWHCGTVEDYTPNTDMYCDYCSGYASLPMAFTKDNDMNLDGYASPNSDHVFIGFRGYSMQFLSSYGLYYPYQYYHFCSLFYRNLVMYGQCVNEALDNACLESDGNTFGYSWVGTEHWIDPDGEDPLPYYYTQMKVLGAGNMGYPY